MNTVYLAVAFIAGIGIALQTTLNGQLAKGIGGNPLAAAMFSFATGAVLLAIFMAFRPSGFESLKELPKQPLWALLGGVLGACALLSYVLLAPRIGLTPLITLAIAGQLTSSMLIDHFGLFGMEQRPVSWIKGAGFLLMLAGLGLTVLGRSDFK